MAAAEKVFSDLAKQYPPEATAWIHSARWSGPVKVPSSHIDPDMSAFDTADPAHVADFVTELQAGHKVKPVVLVKRPGKAQLQLVDGHHRYLAYQQVGRKPRAFIGVVDSDSGPWETMHAMQQDGGQAAPAGTGDTSGTSAAAAAWALSGEQYDAYFDHWNALAGAS